MAENTGLRSLIIDPTKVDPQVDISGLRTTTDTRPELLGSVQDFPGVQFDPTSYSYIEDLMQLYGTGLPMLPETQTDTAQIPGAVDTLVNVGGQSQETGGTTDSITDPTLDTTFQDAGAVDAPGTIGTLGSLGEPTTQIAPTVNVLDEFGRDGNVYADVPPTTVNIPALDLSGTSTDLIDRGVIETPEEFYGRTYNTSPSEYGFLDNEEQLIVNQQYADAYGLDPVAKLATTLTDIVNLSPTVQVGKAIVDAFTPDESVSSQLDIDPDPGLFEGGDPGVDAAENEFGNIQDTPPTVTTTDPIAEPGTAGSFMQEATLEEDYPQVQTPAEQIFDQTGFEGSPEMGGSRTDTGTDSDDSDTFGGSEDQGEIGSDAGFAAQEQNIQENPFDTAEGSGGSSGGGKIVCTMMNKTYGFGSFRNKIWLRQSKDLAPEYQKGYHILFLPLVKISKTNKIVRKILEHIAVHRTIDIRQESRGKTHMLGRIYRKILEPICYWVGKNAKR